MQLNKRMLLASIAAALRWRSPVPRSRRRNTITGASDTEIKIGNINPYSGPASAYGTIGKTHRRLFQEGERRGRHQRPQDQLHHL